MTPEDDVRELRKALDAGPTPGPHKAYESLVFMGCERQAGGFDLRDCPNPEANAKLFAACEPDRIRRILDRLDAAAPMIERYRLLMEREHDATDELVPYEEMRAAQEWLDAMKGTT